MKKVCVMGITPSSLATALIAADNNYHVTLYDANQLKVNYIASGDSLYYRTELTPKMQKTMLQKICKATTIVPHADFFILYVHDNGVSDIYRAVDALLDVLKIGDTVIIESVVPVGTTEQVARYIEIKTGLQAGNDFYCAYTTQRFVPGKIFFELINSSRVIGGINTLSALKAQEFYQTFILADIYTTQAKIAELTTQVITTHNEVEVAFANEISTLCYSLQVNPHEIIDLANTSHKQLIPKPNCGTYEDSFEEIPFDTEIVETSSLLQTAQKINNEKPFQILRLIKDLIENWRSTHITTCKILLLGLTRTANCDDIADSTALYIADQLTLFDDVQAMICEPHVIETDIAKHIKSLVVNTTEGMAVADVIVCLTPHVVFKEIIPQLQVHPYFLDISGLLNFKKEESSKQDHLFWPAKNDQSLKKLYNKKLNKLYQDFDELE